MDLTKKSEIVDKSLNSQIPQKLWVGVEVRELK
jgi:hypothetical protein